MKPSRFSLSILFSLALAAQETALDTCRQLGRAYYENDDFKAAAAQFRRATELAPGSAPDAFNLGLTLMRGEDYPNALAALRQAERLDARLLAPHYVRGIIAKRQSEFPQAIECLKRVVTDDPACVGAYYNLAMCYKALEQQTNAIATLQTAIVREPNNPSCHYQLITLYRRIGNVENAARHAEIFDRLKDTVTEAEKTAEALERSRYSVLIAVPSAVGDQPALRQPGPRFVDVTREAGLASGPSTASLPPPPPHRMKAADFTAELARGYAFWTGGSVAVGDYDGDGHTDVYIVQASTETDAAGNRLYRNDGQGRFTDVTAAAGVGSHGLGMQAVFGDFDNDKFLDLYVVNDGPNVLFRNRGDGTFEEISVKARANEPQFGRRALFVDYDHDNDLDLFIANDVDLTAPPNREVFALPDGFPGQLNTLLRNRGDGTFTDQTDEAGLLVDAAQTRDALFADFDGDHDTDLLVANFDAPSLLFLNARQGRFALGGSFTPPLDRGVTAAAEADFNRDGHSDLIVAQGSSLVLYTNDGLAHFQGLALNVDLRVNRPRDSGAPLRIETNSAPTPPWSRPLSAPLSSTTPSNDKGSDKGSDKDDGAQIGFRGDPPVPPTFQSARSPAGKPGLQPETDSGWRGIARLGVFDFNSDGWPDLLFSNGARLKLLVGTGRGAFEVAPLASGLDHVQGTIADFAAADLDRDGDLDLIVLTRDRGPLVLRNDSPAERHWLALRLYGKKVNRRGYGATVEVAAPGHYARQTATGDLLHFGLGGLTNVDVVRVTWPNGMAQNVIQPVVDRLLEIEEYVKVSACCAFLWADAGRGFKLINEILGIGPLGAPMSATACFPLDCTELTKIEPDQLVPRDGAYELRLTEDLREVAYVDQINLRVVDHPAELEIIPNEMFTGPPFPEDKIFAVRDPRTPRSAVDDRSHDVLDLIRARDGHCPTFPLTPHDGLAQPHSLTLDLGDIADDTSLMLYLDGWIYWADASVSWGLFQHPELALTPLRLEVRDAQGRWQTAIESVGLPTSKGLVVPVDLTGKFLTADRHVRLSTTMCVYFDRVFTSTHDEAARCRVTTLPVTQADLHFRGFAQMSRDALGYERFNYDQVSPTGAWDPPRGHLTRYGEVTRLLACIDDRLVVFGPGDELSLRFDATPLPEPPAGWKRSFVFYANGWVKDGDLNTKCSETIEPLPFHGMSGYPYPATERFPDTPAHREYLRAFQTRPTAKRTGDLPRLSRDGWGEPLSPALSPPRGEGGPEVGAADGVGRAGGSTVTQSPPAEAKLALTDVTASAGLTFRHTIGDHELSSLVEATGVGCAFLDYDNDGWLDLYLVNGCHRADLNDPQTPEAETLRHATDRLFRNRGDGTFTEVTARAGILPGGYGIGVVAGDYDNDGDTDLFVAQFGTNRLYQNRGDGTFAEVAKEAGVADTGFFVGACFLDYDRDGRLDLFAGQYVAYDEAYNRRHGQPNNFPGPLAFPPTPSRLYRNTGDGRFTDVTLAAGLGRPGRAMGTGSFDCDDDAWPDLFVSNDAMENHFYRNQRDGTFKEDALLAGVAFSSMGDAPGAMAVESGDLNGDGRLDLFIPDFRRSCLYLNLGGGLFDEQALPSGVARVVGNHIQWGAALADFDLDGDLDLYVSRGDANSLAGYTDCLLVNHGQARFTDASADAGAWFKQTRLGRGVARGDFNNDGRLDLLVAHLNDAPALLRNDSVLPDRHWLLVKLVGHKSNRDALGARLRCQLGGRVLVRERVSAGSYCSSHDPRVHFGLGAASSVDELEIRWPSGTVQKLRDVPADRVLTLEEPST